MLLPLIAFLHCYRDDIDICCCNLTQLVLTTSFIRYIMPGLQFGVWKFFTSRAGSTLCCHKKLNEVTVDCRCRRIQHLLRMKRHIVGRDSSVGIAIRYELDGLEIETQWVGDLPHPCRLTLRSTHPSVQWVPVSFMGVKWPRRGVNYPYTSSVEAKERVEQHLYSPSEHSWLPIG
jgi:hypothetical protein